MTTETEHPEIHHEEYMFIKVNPSALGMHGGTSISVIIPDTRPSRQAHENPTKQEKHGAFRATVVRTIVELVKHPTRRG